MARGRDEGGQGLKGSRAKQTADAKTVFGQGQPSFENSGARFREILIKHQSTPFSTTTFGSTDGKKRVRAVKLSQASPVKASF